MDDIAKWVSFISDLITIFASSIAVYLFFTKKSSFKAIFSLLVNYTHQVSLSEIKEKLERLNEYNAKDTSDNEQIVYILNEIVGQIKGNERLHVHFKKITSDLEPYAIGKKELSEPAKRAFVSELRERLRNLNVKSIDHLVGESNE